MRRGGCSVQQGGRHGSYECERDYEYAFSVDVFTRSSEDRAALNAKLEPFFKTKTCSGLLDSSSVSKNPDGTCTGCTDPVSGVGPYCQFSNSNDCNGRGTATADGTCISCEAGYAGSQCELTSDNTCNGRGTPVDDGTCTSCETGSAGSQCQFTTADTCNNHGVPANDGLRCECDPTYDPPFCLNRAANCALTAAGYEAALAVEAKNSLEKVLPATLAISTLSAGAAYGYLMRTDDLSFKELTLKMHFWVWFSVWLRIFDASTDWVSVQ